MRAPFTTRARADGVASKETGGFRNEQWEGWELRSRGPANPRHTVLLLPGGLSTARMFDPVLADRRVPLGHTRLVAATPPGFGGLPGPRGFELEWYVEAATRLAVHLRADLVGGHSFGANVALEMAASHRITTPLILLSPSFSMADEAAFFQRIAALSRFPVVGRIPFLVLPAMINIMVRGMVPPAYQAEVVTEMRKSDFGDMRRQVAAYWRYQQRSQPLVERLDASGVRASVVFGAQDEIGLTDAERAALAGSKTITVAYVPDSGHMLMQCNPEATLTAILDAAG